VQSGARGRDAEPVAVGIFEIALSQGAARAGSSLMQDKPLPVPAFPMTHEVTAA